MNSAVTKSNPVHKINWVNTLWLFGSPLAMIATGIWFFLTQNSSYGWWLLFLISSAGTCLAITCGYHRLIAHRSYETNRFIKFIYLFFGAGAFQGSALEWATDHRRHHREVDTENDPYNINQGLWHAHMGWLLYQERSKVYAPDLTRSAMLRFQDRYYIAWAIAAGFIWPMAIGWMMGSVLGGLFFGGFLRVVITQHSTFFINSLCHYIGGRPYSTKVSARDSFVMAIFAFGEGYHNYHHRFQTDYRNGIRWYHWDPSKWWIKGLAILGLAKSLKKVPEPVIFKARMQTDQAQLLARGISADRLTALKLRVETAQERMRLAYVDYLTFKKSVQEKSRERYLTLKAELRVAKLEFKMSVAQWYAYRRTLRALPAYN